ERGRPEGLGPGSTRSGGRAPPHRRRRPGGGDVAGARPRQRRGARPAWRRRAAGDGPGPGGRRAGCLAAGRHTDPAPAAARGAHRPVLRGPAARVAARRRGGHPRRRGRPRPGDVARAGRAGRRGPGGPGVAAALVAGERAGAGERSRAARGPARRGAPAPGAGAAGRLPGRPGLDGGPPTLGRGARPGRRCARAGGGGPRHGTRRVVPPV
ncbi:MAG: hypothetical protein AVDCRST_MAG07-3429, partial [uncultured Frankineae bacterium]